MRWRAYASGLLLPFSTAALAGSVHRLPVEPLVEDANVTSSLGHVRISADQVAAEFGVVTSTLRTVAHNREVGGVPNSYHLLGRAVDVVRRAGITHGQIAAALRSAGYVLIESLDEGTHSHFAFALPAPRPADQAQSQKRAASRLVVDEHGSLLSDLGPPPTLRGALGAPLRVHIRAKP